MASGGIDHGGRRRVGEAAAEHEMIGVGRLDGGGRQCEIAIRHQRGESIAVGGEAAALGIGAIGFVLAALAAFIRRLAPIGRLDALRCSQIIPGPRGRAPR